MEHSHLCKQHHLECVNGSLQNLDSGLDWTMDSCLFETTQPLFSAFFVILICFAIMLSVTSASGVEHVHGSMQTGENYSNTTVNSH